jgi:hypothetical protein
MKENWKGAFAAGAGFFIAFTVLDYITYGETELGISIIGALIIGLLYHIFQCELKHQKKRKRK